MFEFAYAFQCAYVCLIVHVCIGRVCLSCVQCMCVGCVLV